MKALNGEIIYSATDLSNFLHCRHLTALDLSAVNGTIEKPFYKSSLTEMLQQRGQEFEAQFLASLEAEGKKVTRIQQHTSSAHQITLNAMQSGADVIYQAHLKGENFQGWADFLIKTDAPSQLGQWSYQVVDTKLASETRAGAVLQIALYSQILSEYQGLLPELMFIQKPDGEEILRVNDYIAYLRLVQKRFLSFVNEVSATYPEAVTHCDICNWWEICDKRRRQDDQLCYVAGMGKSHIQTFRAQQVFTMADLAKLSTPVPFKPQKGAVQTYDKLVHQASLQIKTRTSGHPAYEVLELQQNQGLLKLSEPTVDDIYFDLEGDPFSGDAGREYVFGWVYQNKYHIIWAESAEKEKEAYEALIDFAWNVSEENPGMHIYHYGPYETSALKRLMGKYGTQADKLDGLLRGEKFVDLLQVVRHSVRAGVERYSLKDLEAYHEFSRTQDLQELSKVKRNYEYLLQTGVHEEASAEMREIIAKYNEEDCRSTASLHHWLEHIRHQKITVDLWDIPRPLPEVKEPSDEQTAFKERIAPIYQKLMDGVPPEASERTAEQQASFILANMLDWYKREEKSYRWEYFRLLNSSLDDLLDEKSAISGLVYYRDAGTDKKSVLHEYKYVDQDLDVTNWKTICNEQGKAAGQLYAIDEENQIVTIKKGPKIADVHPLAIFPTETFGTNNKIEAIVGLGEWVSLHGFNSDSMQFRAGRDLLLRIRPRLIKEISPAPDKTEMIIEMAINLDHGVLPVQGPPGAGKSYSASKMIIALAQKGKKIGITAQSHKVITNLLAKITEDCKSANTALKIIQKVSEIPENAPAWEVFNKPTHIHQATPDAQIIAGTTFMWSEPQMKDSVDYLVVDEAGQLSLIDTLAASSSARNLILMGDPQQLKQPIKGTHPDGTAVSALEHILGENETIPEDQGVLLDITYRMHPDICALDSELFYQGKLHADTENSKINISGNLINKPGLYAALVEHKANTNRSVQEAEKVKQLVDALCDGNSVWTDKKGQESVIKPNHIKIISPFNAQVALLKKYLPQIDIGTVDKFQGQEAPIIIFSMATSDAVDAPRGMEFLFSPNRLNVAISRAQGVFIMVAAPAILEPDCQSPPQMKLANAFCRFAEVAQPI